MKKNCIIGYSISILGGILMIVSAILSLTMTSFAKVLTQGPSLLTVLTSGGNLSVGTTFYVISIALSALVVIASIVGLILALCDKYNSIFLLVVRIVSLLAFLSMIIGIILLALDVAAIEAEQYNFLGFGPFVAVLGTLLLVMGVFFARAKNTLDKKEED